MSFTQVAPCPQTGKGIHPRISVTPSTVIYYNDRTVFTLCTETLSCLHELRLPHKVTVARPFRGNGGATTNDGLLAVGTAKGTLHVYDHKSKRFCGEYVVLGGAIRDLAWTEDGKQVIVGGEGREKFGLAVRAEDGSIQGMLDCNFVGELMGHSKAVDAVAVKGSLAVTAGEDCVLCLHKQEGKNWVFSKSINLKKTIYSLEIAEDEGLLVQTLGNKLITVGQDATIIDEISLGSERVSTWSGHVKVLEEGGAIVLVDGRRYEAHQHGISGLTAIENVIYTWSFDGSIVEYSRQDLQFLRKYVVDGASSVVELRGKAAVLKYDGTLVDLEGNELLTDSRLKGGCQAVSSDRDALCAINASNALLRVGSSVEEMAGQFAAIGNGFVADKSQKVYALDGNLNESLFTHAPGIPTSIATSPDKQYIAIGDDQRRIKVYSIAESYKQIHSWQYHAAKVTHLVWLNRNTVVSAGLDHDLFAWKVGKDEPVAHLKGTILIIFPLGAHSSTISGLIDLVGSIVSCGQDGTMRVFKFEE